MQRGVSASGRAPTPTPGAVEVCRVPSPPESRPVGPSAGLRPLPSRGGGEERGAEGSSPQPAINLIKRVNLICLPSSLLFLIFSPPLKRVESHCVNMAKAIRGPWELPCLCCTCTSWKFSKLPKNEGGEVAPNAMRKGLMTCPEANP